MSSLEATLGGIHRRVMSRRLLLFLSRGLLFGLAPTAVLLAVHPFAPVPWIWLLVVALPGMGMAGGVAAFAWARPRLDGTVHDLDVRLSSFERFTTALECERRGPRNSIEAELVRTTSEAAGRLRPSVLVPRGLPTETKVAAGLLAFVLLGVGILFPRREALELANRSVEVVREVQRVKNVLEEALDEQEEVDPELAKKLKGLMNEVEGAKSLEEVFSATRKALQAVEQAAVKAGNPAMLAASKHLGRVAEYLSKSKTAANLARALAEGDMARAAQLGEQLAKEVRKTGMDPAEAARLAQALRQAAAEGRALSSANISRSLSGGRGQVGPADLANPPTPGGAGQSGGAPMAGSRSAQAGGQPSGGQPSAGQCRGGSCSNPGHGHGSQPGGSSAGGSQGGGSQPGGSQGAGSQPGGSQGGRSQGGGSQGGGSQGGGSQGGGSQGGGSQGGGSQGGGSQGGGSQGGGSQGGGSQGGGSQAGGSQGGGSQAGGSQGGGSQAGGSQAGGSQGGGSQGGGSAGGAGAVGSAAGGAGSGAPGGQPGVGQAFDAAAKGLSGGSPGDAAKSIENMAKVLRREAQANKTRYKALGKADAELSKALESHRRKLEQKARAEAKGGASGGTAKDGPASGAAGDGRGKAGDSSGGRGGGDRAAGGRDSKGGHGDAGTGSGPAPSAGPRNGQGPGGARPGGRRAVTSRSGATRRTPVDARRVRGTRRRTSTGRRPRRGGRGGGAADPDMRGRETSVGVNGEAVDRDRWAAFELAPEGPPDPEVEYERKVGEYLARENVPLEYQEMVREYFDR